MSKQPLRDPSAMAPHTKFKADYAGQQTRRRCLMCHQKFVSTWTGERICKTCKSSTAWKQG